MKTLKHLFIICLLSSLGTTGFAQDIHQHLQWDQLVKSHVDNEGNVDYKAFKSNEKALDAYLRVLEQNPPKLSWTTNQKKAYLINAYNAFTVKLIVKHYPVESIRAIDGRFSKPFTTAFAKIGDKAYSLDDIEKGLLLKMGDPRVHFAVNCASESCPKLADEAFLATTLDQQLDQAAYDFVNSDKNQLSASEVKLSKIFKWYASDFESEGTSVIQFINQYADTSIDEDASIDYLTYSWELNGQ
ncbi:DUF547 domain-containing protein [Psychroflexus tropicus]|uniref:DUF547 domain-containing protein n=1 Tax=Psychroflexus tropicus TaxID=197345 RepID=UPI00037FD276|nr:DUF547 domain-containing protein [Psychroflexus tropicus]